jgi:hypothetical protein
MSGWVLAFGSCCSCRRPFSFNPNKVPSVRIDGERRPVCEDCIDRANAQRRVQGLAPHVPHPAAYEPVSEEEL